MPNRGLMTPEIVPGALDFPATLKNRDAIADVLAELFDPTSHQRLLEVASGSGQHAVYFASKFPNWTIQPTDIVLSLIHI